ncbi:MAG: response regulator [Planctomycetota bacterium]
MNNNDKAIEKENRQTDGQKPWRACPGKCTHHQIAQREALLQAKSSLIDNMIHHIRTLSNAVIGFSDLLLIESLKGDLSDYVQEINHAGHDLSLLANEVLDWTQLLAGSLKVTKIKFRLSDIITEIEKMLSWAAGEKGIEYEIVTDPDMPAYIFSDEDRLLKCLVNLTAGAIKHTSQGCIQLQVQMEQHNGDPTIRFDVIDTGEGIGPDTFKTIFEPTAYRIEMDEELLSQFNSSLTVTTGLPLTKQLCELLDGTIEAKSRVGEGSTFSIRIPAGLNPDKTPKLGPLGRDGEAAEQDSRQPADVSQPTILLVEDQQSNRIVISLMLEALGARVDTAKDGQEALVKVEDNAYDLILMDIKMPKMDGYETTQQLREKGVGLPIVALSAKVFNEKEHHQILTIFDGFLTKPVDSRKLSGTLNKFVNGFSDKTEWVPDTLGPGSTPREAVAIEYGKPDAINR